MKYENNLKNFFKTFILAASIVSILAGCSQVKPESSKDNTIKNNEQKQTNESLVNTNNENWQVVGKLAYVRGTIVSLKQSSDGKYKLNLKVEFNYKAGTDAVDNLDYPFKVGTTAEFVLKNKPKVNLSTNDRIIIYEGQVTADGKSDFLGADIKYYEKQGKYFDMNGMEIKLPPQDYPNSL
ncbi:MAG: hypothetical protein K0R54_2352 [Clostridiaceae bacterium]|jgi:hypothetical protein|nr:hypothetical protein [Clostridiaceae bacterium]